MEQKEKQEANAQILRKSDREKSSETTESERQNIEVAVPGDGRRRQIQFGQVSARLQSARNALRYTPRDVLAGSESPPSKSP